MSELHPLERIVLKDALNYVSVLETGTYLESGKIVSIGPRDRAEYAETMLTFLRQSGGHLLHQRALLGETPKEDS